MVEGKAGRKLLQFPPFHNEILDQAHWDATEAYGRIGVVIAEGVTRSDNGDHGTLVFDRLRDQIAFSFQHAPRREFSLSMALYHWLTYYRYLGILQYCMA